MREETEVNYVCDFCEERYQNKEDCKTCEESCKMALAIKTVVPELADAIESLEGSSVYRLSRILETYEKI